MKKKNYSDSLYNNLFETLLSIPEEDASDPEILDFMLETLQDELSNCEPIARLEDDEFKITRLGILNTIISVLLPGYKLIVEVDEDEQIIEDIYISES